MKKHELKRNGDSYAERKAMTDLSREIREADWKFSDRPEKKKPRLR